MANTPSKGRNIVFHASWYSVLGVVIWDNGIRGPASASGLLARSRIFLARWRIFSSNPQDTDLWPILRWANGMAVGASGSGFE